MIDMTKTEKLLEWVEENPMVTIDKISGSILGDMLQLAEMDRDNFAVLMVKGLAHRLHSCGGNSDELSGRIGGYIDDCRQKLRLAFAAKGNAPALHLFNLEPAKRADLRAVRMYNLEKKRRTVSA